MKKPKLRSSPMRVIVKITIRKDWENQFKMQVLKYRKAGWFVGYPKVVWERKSFR